MNDEIADFSIDEDFDLQQLPFHVQASVLEKLDYQEFALFNQCSRQTAAVCDRHASFRFDYNVDSDFAYKDKSFLGMNCRGFSRLPMNEEIKSRLVFRKYLTLGDLQTEACIYLIQLILSNKVRILGGIEVRSINCHMVLFCQLLRVANIQRLILSNCNTDGLTDNDLEDLYKVPSVTIKRGRNIKDKELLKFKAPHLEICGCRTTTAGLIKFFKQWIDGERDIEHFGIVPSETVDENVVKAVMTANCSGPSREATMRLCRNGPHGVEKLSVYIGQSIIVYKN